jgi:hypothetical protein
MKLTVIAIAYTVFITWAGVRLYSQTYRDVMTVRQNVINAQMVGR